MDLCNAGSFEGLANTKLAPVDAAAIASRAAIAPVMLSRVFSCPEDAADNAATDIRAAVGSEEDEDEEDAAAAARWEIRDAFRHRRARTGLAAALDANFGSERNMLVGSVAGCGVNVVCLLVVGTICRV